MDVKRADGMTDDDFREYWNEPEVAQRMGVIAMKMTRMAIHIDALENRGPWESEEHAHSAAARRVKSRHGMYAHPRPDDDPSDPHRTLPFEVQTRVTRFLDVFNSDHTELIKSLDAAGSVNSFYRASLR